MQFSRKTLAIAACLATAVIATGPAYAMHEQPKGAAATPGPAAASTEYLWGWGKEHAAALPWRNAGSSYHVPIRRSRDPQYTYLPPALSVDAGNGYSLAVMADHTVMGWGASPDGQAGGGKDNDSHGAVKVAGITDAIAVSAGSGHSMALRQDGTVLAWGANNSGQVGDGTGGNDNSPRLKPTPVVGLRDVVAVEAGKAPFSLALKSDGTVWSWGYNGRGLLGQGTTGGLWPRPTRIPGLEDVVKISAGGTHSLALKRDGTVWAWGGDNSAGQLGNGTISEPEDPTANFATPARVIGLDNVVDISAGNRHSVAVKSDGTVWSWGPGTILGTSDPSADTSPVPVQAADLPDPWDPELDVVAVSAGLNFTIALRRDGTAIGWGQADASSYTTLETSEPGSQCRVTKRNSRTQFVWQPCRMWYLHSWDAPGRKLDKVTAISAGYQHVMALRTTT